MPTDISTTATDTFTAVVNAPASGDPRTAASVSNMGQPLVNRSLWNWKRTQAMAGHWAPLGTDLPVRLSNVDLATDTITLAGHGLSNGYEVRFDGSGTPPAPVAFGSVYYVVGVTANTFQLSLTSGGAVLNLTGALAGSVYVIYVGLPEIYLPDTGAMPAGRLDQLLTLFPQLDGANVFTSVNSFSGATLIQSTGSLITAGLTTFLGNAARIIHRAPITVSGASDSLINMANSDHFIIGLPTAARIYRFNQSTLTAPIAFERKRITVPANAAFSISFRREGGVLDIFQNASGLACSYEIEVWFDGTNWRGGQYSGLGTLPGGDY